DMTEDIIRKSNVDSRIKYYGFIPKYKVLSLLKKASLLINLRDKNDEYTKYSFPSKMFEYMASGTPVLTTELDGIPSQYYNFVYSVDSYETEIIVGKIKEILNIDYIKRKEKGNLAQNFIVQEKNPTQQVEKIINLTKSI